MSGVPSRRKKTNKLTSFLDPEDGKTIMSSIADMYGTWQFYTSVVKKDHLYHFWLLVFSVLSTITGVVAIIIVIAKLRHDGGDCQDGACQKLAKTLPILLWLRWLLASEVIAEDLPQIVFSYLSERREDTGELSSEALINLITSLYNLVQNLLDMIKYKEEVEELTCSMQWLWPSVWIISAAALLEWIEVAARLTVSPYYLPVSLPAWTDARLGDSKRSLQRLQPAVVCLDEHHNTNVQVADGQER